MDQPQEYLEFEAKFIRQTDNAVLLEIDDESYWIPFSQLEDNGEDFRDGWEGRVYITEWLCEQKGLQ